MKKLYALMISALLLIGCAQMGFDDSSGSSGSDGFQFPTPRLIDYSQSQRERAALELESLPEGSFLPVMIGDYSNLRRAVCAIESWQQPVCVAIQAARRAQPDPSRVLSQPQ